MLSAQHLENIIGALNNRFDLSNIFEFTMEANPGEAPQEKLHTFRSLGVNRLSIGIQSFKPHLLRFLSRIHTFENVFKTYQNALDVGFENINCDLIYNIPNQTLEDWQSDLDTLIKLNPEHISAYSLTVEQNTPLFDLVKSNSVIIPKDEMHLQFTELAFETLLKNNYQQYEISNYSQKDMECLHNLHYWKHDKYLGFGPSAHSFDGKRRWKNINNIDKYIKYIANGESIIDFSETLSEIDIINEIVGFGLRMNKGFKKTQIPINFSDKFEKQFESVKSKFPNMIIEDNNHIKLNQKGFNFADAIAVEMMLD